MKNYDVITVGSATIDVFAHTDKSELIKIMDSQHHEQDLLAYPSGSKLLITELDFTSGGGGTNTAVSLARLGLKTAYLGCLGRDENGNKIVSLLKKEKVDFVGTRNAAMTGYSIVLDSIEHDRTILTYKGANNQFHYADIKKTALNTKWFYFSAMTGDSFETLKQVAGLAKKKGIKVAFNPSSYLAEKGIDFIMPVLEATELLILNDEEAALLIGQGSVEEMLTRLHQHVPIVVITMGKKGACVIDNKHIYYGKPHGVKPVETTGAGDAFASSFLAALIKKNDIEFAIKLGTTNAESVILHHGAKNKLLKWPEALRSMKKQPVKVTRKKI